MASISSLGIGSGLDLNGLLDQLRDAEREKLQPIVRQQEQQMAKISAFGTLQGAASKFQDAVSKLGDSSLYQSLSSSVTGDSVSSAASSEAQPGRYDVSVQSLARSQSLATQGFAERDTELGAGTMTIHVGTGDKAQTLELDIAQADSSLESIRDAINAEGKGVTASIVNDGSGTPHRLVLSSTETGTESAIQSVEFTSATDAAVGNQLSYNVANATMDETVAAENAELTVNGIAISSQSNTVEGAIQGVTLDLAATGDAEVEVELNNRAMREAITDFVSAYNDLKETTGTLTSFDAETGASGTLLGDNTLRTMESRLRSALGGGVSEGAFSVLNDIGISLQKDGTLELDDERLDEVILNDRQALTEFFTGSESAPGMAGKLDETLGQMLDEQGLIGNATSGLETSVENLDERYAQMEKSVERTIARYRQQFGQLDGLIASMNQTSSYLTQQFDALDAQLGRN